ncbi:MAG: ABC transporter ATP-binding protein [Candidatus Eremiobacteraeota bacterium]|nr:ABC transporter ATP-binding protein [Candidatus Eremiobacteraeota bacterium]MCW5869005.1 ABC transporter ATP-binding protein [Candidatus Eremiobacteraeota bacterium]
MSALLELQGVSAAYGAVKALHEVSLKVDPGQVVTLIGANGAGKSTCLKVITGLLPASQGRVLWQGRDLAALSAHLRVGEGMAMSPEGRQVFPRMTVLENLEMGAFTRKDDIKDDLERAFHLFPILKERIAQAAGTLSGGEQQMLAIGRALMSKPRLLILDEPSLGLAPLIVKQIFAIIREIRELGLAVLLVEQNARQALQVADFGYVFEVGRAVLSGPAGELSTNPDVQKAYLGL